MIQSIKWAERKFAFDFPIGVFPWIVERLRGTPARIEDLVRKIKPSALTMRADGKWSIQENAGHLIKVEELHDGRIDDYLAGEEILRPADMENRRTQDADYNSMDIDSILEAFRTTRMNFVKRVEGLDDDIIGQVSFHPRLKVPMRFIDMTYFAAEHDDFHLAVIRRLSREFGKLK